MICLIFDVFSQIVFVLIVNVLILFVVDDDYVICSLFVDSFGMYGYCVEKVVSVQEMDIVLVCYFVVLVLFDVMMLGEDGFVVCWCLSGKGGLLVVMFSVFGDEFDCVVGFEIGVSYYLLKLCSLCEVFVIVCVVLCEWCVIGDV